MHKFCACYCQNPSVRLFHTQLYTHPALRACAEHQLLRARASSWCPPLRWCCHSPSGFDTLWQEYRYSNLNTEIILLHLRIAHGSAVQRLVSHLGRIQIKWFWYFLCHNPLADVMFYLCVCLISICVMCNRCIMWIICVIHYTITVQTNS